MSETRRLIKNLTILYIENDESVRIDTLNMLQQFCDNVIVLEDANNALEVYSKTNPNIIITDIVLDEINGIEFSKMIREMDKKIPIVFLSSSTDKNFLLEAVRLKLVDFLVKPVQNDILLETLKKCIEHLIDYGLLHIKINENITYDFSHKNLLVENEVVKLTANELTFIELLLKNRNRYLSSQEIKYSVWSDEFATDGALKSLIHKLRKKLGKDTITSSARIGYKVNING